LKGVKREIIKNDPAVELPETIFFRDMGVKKILPIFYISEDKDLDMSKAEVEKKWGLNVANTIFGTRAKSTKTRPIDKKLIRQIWEAPDANGESTPMLIKIPGCPLE
jgi:hypothetical protein